MRNYLWKGTVVPNLTKEQRDIVKGIVREVRRGSQLVTFGGVAGSGKTTCVAFLAQSVPDFADFAVCSYTGKAANVLRKKGLNASTIHSLIYKPVKDERGRLTFYLKAPHEVSFSGLLVDEASMVSNVIYRDLLTFGVPIVFIGDHGQLEPVGQDINVMANPEFRLETIHRNAGEIAYFAEHLRKGYPARYFVATEKVNFIDPSQLTGDMLLAVDQMICAYNRTRVERNQETRQLLGRQSLVEAGDRVMCLRNNRMKGLFNGMQGIVTKVHGKYSKFDFQSDGITYPNIVFDPNQFGQERNQFEFGEDSPEPFDYANCITAHKCVHPNTLVETSEGLLPISNIKSEGLIACPTGVKSYRGIFNYPVGEAIHVVTKHGYDITVTPNHKVEMWDGKQLAQMKASDLSVGKFVRLKKGITIDPIMPSVIDMPDGDIRSRKFTNQGRMSAQLAEFFGLMVADGTVFKGGFRLAKRHNDVLIRFEEMCNNLFQCRTRRVMIGKTGAVEVSSRILEEWFGLIGGMSPNQKSIPECILRSPADIHRSFLRGLMEDGTVALKDHVEFYSCYPKLLSIVKTMLLRLGIVTASALNRFYIYGSNAVLFREKIGFISSFKNNRLDDLKKFDRYTVIPVSRDELDVLKPYLTEIDWNNVRQRGYISVSKAKNVPFLAERSNDYYYDRIAKLEMTTCPSMCLEVPNGHRFLQNGFPFWNSQGDEWDNGLVFEQICSRWDHKRWAYTAASRFKNHLSWVCPNKPVYKPAWL